MKPKCLLRFVSGATLCWLVCLASTTTESAASLEVTAATEAPPIIAEACGDRIVRFFSSDEASSSRLPSLALEKPLPATGPAPVSFPVQPIFQRIAGRHAVRIAIESGTSLYGTGEVPGPLLRNGRKTTAWNFDAYGYGEQTLHLYQSHPWVLAVRPDGTAFGVLVDTSYRCHIDLTRDILFIADGPAYPVIVIDRDRPRDVVQALADLIGKMPLPPLWALGYHQCRYSYYPDSRVREIAETFRQRRIPCDVIWLDIDYMDGFRSFTFHPQDFPEPKNLIDDLHARNFHSVAIIDPGIRWEPGYFVYDSGAAIDAWVRTRTGEIYVGAVWPGDCVFPDFTNREVRSWWADLYGDFLATGIDGVWNDMNEPAIFNVDSKTMPLDNVHRADPELGGTGPHARYHNVYGMLMARATREGCLQWRPERRAFVLSRANFLGGHRYAAAWTGDNVSTWHHLDMSIPMALNLGLSGQPFCGPDIGGFAHAGSAKMFARWMGFGALLPFARGHTGKGNIDKEPWAFGPEVEETCRQALQCRYRLLPFLYTLFREASQNGLPVARPLFFADPTDPVLRSVDDAFLLGDDVLVACQTSQLGGREIPLPSGIWKPLRILDTDQLSPDLPDLYIRGGGIVPIGPQIEYAGQLPLDPLELVVCLDEDGHAEGTLYEDAGKGREYLRGEYSLTLYTARLEESRVTISGEVVAGDWQRPDRRLDVHVLWRDRTIQAEGKSSQAICIELPR